MCFSNEYVDIHLQNIRFAHNDVAPDGRNDVMFAHYAVRRNIIYAVYIIAEGNITCP